MTREELITKKEQLLKEIEEIDKKIKKIDDDIVYGKVEKVVSLLRELYCKHNLFSDMFYRNMSIDLDDMADLIEEKFLD